MDLRDYQIILELYRQPFASNERIGRAVGVTGNAVTARLGRMERVGLLNGFYVMPVAALFRRYWHIFAFQTGSSEPDLRKILAIDDVVNVWRSRPRTLMVNTYALTRGAPPPPALVKLFKHPPHSVVLPDPPDRISAADAVLSPLDWRVVDALLDGPRAPLSALAKASGLSAKTVRKRRDALVGRGYLGIIPNLDTSRETGLIVYSGHVAVQSRSDFDSVHGAGISVINQLHEPPAVWILGHAASYSGFQEVELSLRSIPGVVSVELVPSRGGALATDRLRGWIREELERWKIARPARGSRRSLAS